MIFGPDVSDFQEDVDWHVVRSSGRLFGFAKATEGRTFVAGTLEANRRGMAAAGLVLRGLYHFARVDRNPAQAEADHFLATVGPLEPGEVAVLDLEQESGHIGHVPTGAWVLEWLDAVEAATGKPPWLYSNAPYLASIDTSRLTRFPLWVSGYGRNDGQVPGDDFRPGTDRWARAVVWQYTSNATVPGVRGQCDDNVFEGTTAELAALAGGTVPAVPALTTGWQEIDRFLGQEGVEINVPPEDWQTTGGVHTATSWHYKGMARDYSAGMGCDEAAVVETLRPFAIPGGPIVELFHAPTGTWLKDGAFLNVGGHTDHAHVAIRPGASLPRSETPPVPSEEETMALSYVVVRPGESVTIPVPVEAGGAGWKAVSVSWAAPAPGTKFRGVVGPDWRPIAGDGEHIDTMHVAYLELSPGDSELQVSVPTKAKGGLPVTFMVEAR